MYRRIFLHSRSRVATRWHIRHTGGPTAVPHPSLFSPVQEEAPTGHLRRADAYSEAVYAQHHVHPGQQHLVCWQLLIWLCAQPAWLAEMAPRFYTSAAVR